MNSQVLTRRLSLIAATFVLALLAKTGLTFGYNSVPLYRAIAEHPIVLVAEITERDGDKVTAVPIATIKGRKEMSYELPAVWSAESKFFNPLPLEVGKKYILMLRIDDAGRPALSNHFAAESVQFVTSVDAPVVRAATILHALSQRKNPKERERILAKAWENETDATKLELLRNFVHEPDEATVPFLLQAMSVDDKHSSFNELAGWIIQRHGYRDAIPGLLKTLEQHDWACIYPATTLGKLKAREAYEPIMKLIEDKDVGNRDYFIQALCYLQDDRSGPFLIETLKAYHDNKIHLHDSWVEPLQSALEIPNRDLQLLAIERLGRIEWFRANAALGKIQELRAQRADDAEFCRVADATIKHIDR